MGEIYMSGGRRGEETRRQGRSVVRHKWRNPETEYN
jgi:hypothetical protein